MQNRHQRARCCELLLKASHEHSVSFRQIPTFASERVQVPFSMAQLEERVEIGVLPFLCAEVLVSFHNGAQDLDAAYDAFKFRKQTDIQGIRSGGAKGGIEFLHLYNACQFGMQVDQLTRHLTGADLAFDEA